MERRLLLFLAALSVTPATGHRAPTDEKAALQPRSLETPRPARQREGASPGGEPRASALTQSGSSIPSLIFFMGPWDPNEIVEHNREFVPEGTEFHYYDYSQVDESVKRISDLLESSEGLSGSWDAYRNLRPYSYRSDLWRYMILWEQGGIYMDAKLLFATPISNWVDREHDELALCNDAWQCGQDQIFQSTIAAARPRHRSTLAVIKKIVSNIQNHYYGGGQCPDRSDLLITGPGALTYALMEAGFKPSVRCKLVVGSDQIGGREVDGRLVQLHEDGATLIGSDVQEHHKMRGCTNCNIYGDLFQERAIYCDEAYRGTHPDPCKEHGNATSLGEHMRSTTPTDEMQEALIRGGWNRDAHYWSKIV